MIKREINNLMGNLLKYQQIAIEIEKHIEDNALQQGDKLPVLEALMAHFEVSKSTITKLDLLEKKGAMFQVRGSRIFVRRLKRKGYSSLLINFKWRGGEGKGKKITLRLVQQDIE